MSFEMAESQYDSMEPPDWEECPVCEDQECECDFEGTRRMAAFAFADTRIKAAKEEPEHYRRIL